MVASGWRSVGLSSSCHRGGSCFLSTEVGEDGNEAVALGLLAGDVGGSSAWTDSGPAIAARRARSVAPVVVAAAARSSIAGLRILRSASSCSSLDTRPFSNAALRSLNTSPSVSSSVSSMKSDPSSSDSCPPLSLAPAANRTSSSSPSRRSSSSSSSKRVHPAFSKARSRALAVCPAPSVSSGRRTLVREIAIVFASTGFRRV
mmetsp:Transcript_9180/g.27862  ORF Transcript_9180/g.27862 Transcript_9180/m.27862 type:complete len:203 (-) Transcript_9180:24-632(-)